MDSPVWCACVRRGKDGELVSLFEELSECKYKKIEITQTGRFDFSVPDIVTTLAIHHY
jgi:hypothetical protein